MCWPELLADLWCRDVIIMMPLFLEFISMDLREILQEMKWGAIVYWRGILLMHLDQRSK